MVSIKIYIFALLVLICIMSLYFYYSMKINTLRDDLNVVINVDSKKLKNIKNTADDLYVNIKSDNINQESKNEYIKELNALQNEFDNTYKDINNKLSSKTFLY